jgi:zinc protease
MTKRVAVPIRRRWILLGGLALAALPAVAEGQIPAGSDPLPIDPQVTIGQLPNGLRYYIRSNGRPEGRAELRLVVNAGSVLEDDDQRGLAHFVEHMAFNGTRNFEEHELVRYLESIGMRFGPDLNAYTSFDETVYMLTIPTDREDVVSTSFQILADWATGITFAPEEIEKERGVVIEEWRGRLGAQSRLTDAQFPVLLGGSRYAERLPIGLVETLQSFPHDALLRFYRDWYRPDLMAVIAVGDFDPERIESLVREHFGSIPATSGARTREHFPVPEFPGTRFLTVTDPELTNTRVEVRHKLPRREVETVADHRQVLLERLHSVMLNTRLAEITQKPNSPFLGASTGRGRLVRPVDMYSLVALVADNGVERGLEALLVEAERVARHGFTNEELERSRLNMLRALERAHAERERTNSGVYASAYVSHFLDAIPIPGIDFEFAVAQALLPNLTLDEVNDVARGWLSDDDRIVLVSAPEKDGLQLPDEARILGLLASIDGLQIDPYDGGGAAEPLLASLPAGGSIVGERRHAEVGVTEWTLANGARVLLKPTSFRDDEILIRGYAPGGLSLASDEEYLSASFATDVVGVSGVGTLSAVALQRTLAGKAASVAPFIGETEQGISGSASPRDAETLFQLIYQYFTAPRLDDDAVTAMIEQIEALLANRDADPNAAFSDTLQMVINSHHPRARPLTAERLSEVDVDRALEFYRDRFTDASGFTFVIVGNADEASIKPFVERYIGGLPAAGVSEMWRDNGIRPPEGVVTRTVRQGLEPRATTRIIFTGPYPYSRERSHAIRSLASILDLRLMDQLREDLGATYGVQVSGSASRQPDQRYTFGIGFGSSPERLDELVEATFAALERLKQDGPTEDELARVKEMQRRERETSLRQNGFWLGQIAAYDREGFELSDILTADRLTEELTAELIRETAREVLRPDNFIRVTLLPAN